MKTTKDFKQMPITERTNGFKNHSDILKTVVVSTDVTKDLYIKSKAFLI